MGRVRSPFRDLALGIYDRDRYLSLGERRRYSGARVAYSLLRVGAEPTADEIRTFEDICFTLRLANGTWRTTFRNRFRDVDAECNRILRSCYPRETPIRIQDRAVSSGLTSCEWATELLEAFPQAEFEASDLLTELLEISTATGEIYITEPGGTPLQYISPPFVVALNYPESWRNPLLRLVAARARARFARTGPAGRVASISCVHPEAQALARRNPRFSVRVKSVFARTPGECEVLRTMNILNRSYFSAERLEEAAGAAFDSVTPGGFWIVGKTREDDFTNHATIFRRMNHGWEVVVRLGSGSEIEELVLKWRIAA